MSRDPFESARMKYRLRLGAGFYYEFSDGDHKRIQALVNELRDMIVASSDFDERHRERILEKLEAVQKELHKRMTSLGKLWDLIGEGGVVLGKFGEDAKPIFDRIREICEIAWRTTARAEELPSGARFPLLTAGDLGKDEPSEAADG